MSPGRPCPGCGQTRIPADTPSGVCDHCLARPQPASAADEQEPIFTPAPEQLPGQDELFDPDRKQS